MALEARVNELEEDIGTMRINDRARAELAAGREIELPFSVVEALADGKNRLRVLREFRSLTQQQLSEASGVDQASLSLIEGGKRLGTLAVYRKLARALKVPLPVLTGD
jgi:DNA-binding XRE family transcriptional regulator